jgi:hypothetical protein
VGLVKNRPGRLPPESDRIGVTLSRARVITTMVEMGPIEAKQA